MTRVKTTKVTCALKSTKCLKLPKKTTSDKKKETTGQKVKHKKKSKSDGIPANPWLYAETVPLLPEMGKIDIKGLESLECRLQYQISVVKLENKKLTKS